MLHIPSLGNVLSRIRENYTTISPIGRCITRCIGQKRIYRKLGNNLFTPPIDGIPRCFWNDAVDEGCRAGEETTFVRA